MIPTTHPPAGPSADSKELIRTCVRLDKQFGTAPGYLLWHTRASREVSCAMSSHTSGLLRKAIHLIQPLTATLCCPRRCWSSISHHQW